MLVLPENAPAPTAVTALEPTLAGITTLASLPLYSVITPPDAPKLFSGFVVGGTVEAGLSVALCVVEAAGFDAAVGFVAVVFAAAVDFEVCAVVETRPVDGGRFDVSVPDVRAAVIGASVCPFDGRAVFSAVSDSVETAAEGITADMNSVNASAAVQVSSYSALDEYAAEVSSAGLLST